MKQLKNCVYVELRKPNEKGAKALAKTAGTNLELLDQTNMLVSLSSASSKDKAMAKLRGSSIVKRVAFCPIFNVA